MPVRRHDRPPGLGHTAHGHQRWVGNHAAGQATETALEELAVEAVDGWDCTVVTLAGPLGPERVSRCLDLRPELTAPRAARALVRQACVDWDIPIQAKNAAVLVVSELTLNSVVHAGTPLNVLAFSLGSGVGGSGSGGVG